MLTLNSYYSLNQITCQVCCSRRKWIKLLGDILLLDCCCSYLLLYSNLLSKVSYDLDECACHDQEMKRKFIWVSRLLYSCGHFRLALDNRS